jgi:hypothetical protein
MKARYKYRTRTQHCLELETEESKCSIEVQFPVYEGSGKVVEFTDGSLVVGYLCHDEHCENPLEDCDGVGKIIDRRHCRPEDKREVDRLLKIGDYADDEELERDPYCVLLDVYSHGGDAWSLRGEGMQCSWDTSHGAGLWVPDKYCRDSIASEVLEKLLPAGIEVKYANEAYTYTLKDGDSRRGYKTMMDAWLGAAAVLGFDTSKLKEDMKAGIREAAGKAAAADVETYNAWLNGDCYGVCTERFDANREPIPFGDEACWGYIGLKFAKESLEDSLKWAIKAHTKPGAAQLKDSIPVS